MVMAAAGLGLVATSSAHASCAGPQLALEQRGATVPARRVGEGETERILYDIRRDQPLQVNGSNLTFDCQDTHSATPGGCGEPVPQSIEPIVPMHNAELVLSQRGRSWTLANLGTSGPDLTTRIRVTLPRAVRPGPATLSLLDRQEDAGAELELVIA